MWKDLTMEQRAEVIKMAIQGGLRNLTDIRSFYDNSLKREDGGSLNSYKENQFAKGGNKPVTTGGAGYIPQALVESPLQQVRRDIYRRINPTSDYNIAKTLKGMSEGEFKYNVRNISDFDYEKGYPRNTDYTSIRGIKAPLSVVDDIWAEYLQIPQKDRKVFKGPKIRQSNYTPSKGGNSNTKYYALPLTEGAKAMTVREGTDLRIGENRVTDSLESYGNTVYNLGDYTIGRGIDKRGDYISYYDVFDLNPFSEKYHGTNIPILNKLGDASFGMGKPVHIYDRIYLDDFYGVEEPTHATYLPEVTVYGRNKKALGGKVKSSFVRNLETKPTILEQVAEYNKEPKNTKTTENKYQFYSDKFKPLQQRIREQKAANQRERNIAKHYLAAGPNIANLAKAAYHWYNSVPYLGGEPEDGSIMITGTVDVPGMRNPKDILKGASTVGKLINKANAAKITPAQWTAAQDAAIARGDMAEAQRLRDLHFKVSAQNTKIVDAEGNPLHTYHGGAKGITQFLNPNEFNSSIKLNNYYKNGRNRVGIYTSDWKSYAKQYARGYKKKDRDIYDLYVNMENPRYVGYLETKLNQLRNLNPFKKRNYLNPAIIRPDHKEQLLKGYDGVKWDVENAVFDGKQLKSADAVTYDNKGIRIPLGERDNFNINDIRYAIAPILAGGVGYGAYRNQKSSGGSIHIAPSKRGTFTAAASKHGMGVQEFASKVLANREDYSSAMVKKANFARNASKWKH